MWTEIRRAYGDSARVALALPLLFALPLVAELIQHVIEYRIGLFESFAAMEATGDHSARMGFGQVKILSLILLRTHIAYGSPGAEASWILEDNHAMRQPLEAFGGRVYRRWRVYESALTAP